MKECTNFLFPLIFLLITNIIESLEYVLLNSEPDPSPFILSNKETLNSEIFQP